MKCRDSPELACDGSLEQITYMWLCMLLSSWLTLSASATHIRTHTHARTHARARTRACTHTRLCQSHLSFVEEHLVQCQPFIICHQYHLGNDLFQPVTMTTVICMEITSPRRRMRRLLLSVESYVGCRMDISVICDDIEGCVLALHSFVSSRLNVLMSVSASRGHCGDTGRSVITTWTWRAQQSSWQSGSCLPIPGNSAALHLYKRVTCTSERYLLSICSALAVWGEM